MNTVELSREIAKASGLRVSRVEELLKYTFAKIVDIVANGGTVKIHNFGNFSTILRSARKGRNPQTGDTINVPALKSGRWSVSSNVKDVINGRTKVADLYKGINPVVVPTAAAKAPKTAKKAKKAAAKTTPLPPPAPPTTKP